MTGASFRFTQVPLQAWFILREVLLSPASHKCRTMSHRLPYAGVYRDNYGSFFSCHVLASSSDWRQGDKSAASSLRHAVSNRLENIELIQTSQGTKKVKSWSVVNFHPIRVSRADVLMMHEGEVSMIIYYFHWKDLRVMLWGIQWDERG